MGLSQRARRCLKKKLGGSFFYNYFRSGNGFEGGEWRKKRREKEKKRSERSREKGSREKVEAEAKWRSRSIERASAFFLSPFVSFSPSFSLPSLSSPHQQLTLDGAAACKVVM